MSLIQGTGGGLGGAGAPGGSLAGGDVFSHTIGKSLKLDDSSGGHLTISSASPTATNRKKVTISCWVKRSTIGTEVNTVFWASTSGLMLQFFADNTIYIYDNNAGGWQSTVTNGGRLFRDTGAWYHLALIIDTTQSISSNRANFYINGELQTLNSYPGVNTDITWHTGSTMKIGNPNDATDLAGYIAEFISIDGQDVSISDLGETVGGVWTPKDVSGLTLGDAGFYLKFDNDSDIGNDSGSNNIDFTPSNLVAADVVLDSPTNNFPTFNPLNKTGQTLTHSEGNLEVASSSFWSSSIWSRMTMAGHGGGTGKFYAEFVNYGSSGGGSTVVGIGNYESLATNTTNHNDAIIYYYNQVRQNGTTVTLGGNYSSTPGISGNEVVRMAWDCSNGKVWIGGSQEFFDVGSGVGDPANGTNATGTISSFAGAPIGVLHNRSTNTGRCIMNFGQNGTFNGTLTAGGNSDANGIGDFFYPVPSGFVALCTSNLPDLTIGPGQDTQADDHFETILYTGNGAEQHIGSGGVQHPQDTTTIANSLRFNNDDTPRLSKLWGRAATDDTTWTVSMWVKRSSQDGGGWHTLFSEESEAWTVCAFYNDTLYIQINAGGAAHYIQTNRLFKDFSAFYHIVVAFDEDNSTAEHRLRLYINGTEETSFSTDQRSSISSSSNSNWNTNGKSCAIGARSATNNSLNFDGYMADFHNIDGQQLTPSSFGQVGANGYWIPKAYSGSYGNNGFRLTFQNSSYLGYDYQTSDRSGTTNDWTVAGLTSTDQVIDSPTQNFATLDPIYINSQTQTFAEGNLDFSSTQTGNNPAVVSTFAVNTGKWYWEVYIRAVGNTANSVGIASKPNDLPTDSSALYSKTTAFSYQPSGSKRNNADVSYGATWTTGDIIGVALDLDAGTLKFYKNGAIQNSGTPAFIGLSSTEGFTSYSLVYNSGAQVYNFGQDDSFNNNKPTGTAGASDANGVGAFYYTPPSDHLALMDDNIPQTGIASPDLVWIKARSAAKGPNIYDSVRGPGNAIFPNDNNQTNAGASTFTDRLLSFGNQGFTLGENVNVNERNTTFASWNWKAGGIAPTQTYVVTVENDGGNKYRFDGNDTNALTLNLQEGGTYTFDQSHTSNGGGGTHPLRFSTTSNGTHGGGSEYTTGVTTSGTPGQAGAKTVITVAHNAPTLYYYCTNHSGMGGQANTTATHGSSNFLGSLPSIVSANQTSRFSIATFTMPDAQKTIGHGLGVKPDAMFFKNTSAVGDWQIWHNAFGEDTDDVVRFNSTDGKKDAGGAANWMQAISPTLITVQSAGNYFGIGDYVLYSFANVDGYSSFGQFNANSAADGSFVYLGFRPAYLILKRRDTDGVDWSFYDSKRLGFNVDNNNLRATAGSPATEQTDDDVDLLSNGFKCRRNFANNQGTVLYFAWAEQPFKFANAR